MTWRGWAFWIAATIGVAVVVHVATLSALPRIVMARAEERIGRPNTMHYGRQPDATSRRVVRPSPDMLYSACPFDLSKGPLRVTAHVPHSTYWSIAAFDADTNTVFVRNDRQVAGDEIDIVAIPPGTPAPTLNAASPPIILDSPTARGLILIRMVIDDEHHLPALVALQHQARCETLRTPH